MVNDHKPDIIVIITVIIIVILIAIQTDYKIG